MKVTLYTNCTTADATKDMLSAIDCKDFSLNHIVVVPDKYSLQTERFLLSSSGRGALFNVRVVGITKLAGEILSYFGVQDKPLSPSECLLLVQQAVENVGNDFLFLRKADIDFCYGMQKLISQLKSSCVRDEELDKDPTTVKGAKMHDIALVQREYNHLLGGRLDANERLAKASVLAGESPFENTIFYFGYFDSFTAEAFALIENLIKSSKGVNFSLATPLSVGNEYIYDKDIFGKLQALSKKLGVMLEVKSASRGLPVKKDAVLRGLLSYEKITESNDGFYNLFGGHSIQEEVKATAKLIYYFLNKGYKFSDISVRVGKLEKYQDEIEKVFQQFNFSYFIDSAMTLDKTLLARTILDFFECVSMGYSKDKIVCLLTNCILTTSQNQELAEKVLSQKIEGKSKYKKYVSSAFNYDWVLEGLANSKTSKEFSLLLRKFLSEIEPVWNEYLDALTQVEYLKEANIFAQATEEIINILDTIDNFSQEDYYQSYYKKLKLLMSFVKLSSVPTFVDGISVCDATDGDIVEGKILFILGGELLPATSADNGLLSDSELESLVKDKKIEPSIRMINRRNRFKLFSLISSAKERLIITYQLTNEEGRRNALPAYITSLNQIFSQHEEKLSDLMNREKASSLEEEKMIAGCKSIFAQECYAFLNDEERARLGICNQFAFKDLKVEKGQISSQQNDIFFKDGKVRVTALEQYFACPFKHFALYGLSLKEPHDDDIDYRDIGNLCHKGAELLLNELKNGKTTDIEMFVNCNFDKILSLTEIDKKIALASEKKSLKGFLRKHLLSFLKDVQREFLSSSFKPLYLEMKFSNLTLGKRKIPMIGKADRIDKCGDYFRIIDYKTGQVGSLLKDLYFGNKLQLFLYQRAVREKLKLCAGGVFYFNAKFDYSAGEEDKMLLKGLVENDDFVIESCDRNLGLGQKSKILSVDLSSDSKKKFKGSAIAKQPFSLYENYAQQVASRAVDEICEGYVQAKPCGGACDKCRFASLCGYRKLNGQRLQSVIGDFGCGEEVN